MNGAEKLRLVSVCDKETGVCLFQRAWQWRGDQERSCIGNLVQSFYQFAREVDQGGTQRVCTLVFDERELFDKAWCLLLALEPITLVLNVV